jgi:hypothetical protein
MSPEDRERFQARMREGGGRGFGGANGQGGDGGGFGNRQGGQGAPGGQGGSGLNRQGAGARSAMAGNRQGQAPTAQGAQTIDSLFGPLPMVETRGTAWQYENKQLKMLRLRLGVTDTTFTEILNETDIPANAEVVTNMVTGLEPARTTTPGQQQGNPLMGPQRGGPGGGGRGPGGGGRGF